MLPLIALVSPFEARHVLNHADYQILDARPYADYISGHIPGAIWTGWEDWCEQAPLHAGPILAQAGYWGVLKASTTISTQRALELVGLQRNRPVLVYADGLRSKGREARIAWMLLYYGAVSVSLLNGGWSAWLKSGGSTDLALSALPTGTGGHFQVALREERRVQLQQLRQDIHSNTPPLLIDTRSYDEFVGRSHAYQPRQGRLPSAIHMPFTALFDDEGNVVTKSVYIQRLRPEIRKADRLVAYCEVGVRSCLFALLHELYTGQIVANFDGSLMEWALDSTLPLECDVPDERTLR